MAKLTKRQKDKLQIERTDLENDLNLMLIQALGLSIDPMGYVVDDDTGSRLSYKKKYFKSDAQEYQGTPFHNNDMRFTPFTDKKIMPLLFQKYINDNDIYSSAYCTVTDEYADKKERLRVVTDYGTENSSSFHDPVYSYADYIFKHELCGTPSISEEVSSKLSRLDDINHELSME